MNECEHLDDVICDNELAIGDRLVFVECLHLAEAIVLIWHQDGKDFSEQLTLGPEVEFAAGYGEGGYGEGGYGGGWIVLEG